MEKRIFSKVALFYTSYLIIFLLLSCQTTKNHHVFKKFYYPYFFEIMETYYFANYSYPITADQLLNFFKQEKYLDESEQELFQFTLTKIEKDSYNYNFQMNENRVQVSYKNRIFYDEQASDVCFMLKDDWLNYSRLFIFHNSEGKIIRKNDDLTNKLIINERKIGSNYEFIEYREDSSIVCKLISYEKNVGISDFCTPENNLMIYPYFQEIKNYLDTFTTENNLSKIIHAVPVRY